MSNQIELEGKDMTQEAQACVSEVAAVLAKNGFTLFADYDGRLVLQKADAPGLEETVELVEQHPHADYSRRARQIAHEAHVERQKTYRPLHEIFPGVDFSPQKVPGEP